MFVLIGEATHGTAEFYRIRAEITRRLILEEGFDAIAVEADWLDAYRVNHIHLICDHGRFQNAAVSSKWCISFQSLHYAGLSTSHDGGDLV